MARCLVPYTGPSQPTKLSLILITVPSPTSSLSIFNALGVQPRKGKNPHQVIALSHSGSVSGVNAQFACGAARASDRYTSARPSILPVAAVLWGRVTSRSRRQEKPPPIWHTRGMNSSRAYFYEFVASYSHERIITYKSPHTYRMASHLSVPREKDDGIYNHTAFRFAIDRSKNDSASEAGKGHTRWKTLPRCGSLPGGCMKKEVAYG